MLTNIVYSITVLSEYAFKSIPENPILYVLIIITRTNLNLQEHIATISRYHKKFNRKQPAQLFMDILVN